MDELTKQKLLEKFGEKITELGNIKNPILAAQRQLQIIGGFIDDVWQKGYNTGFKKGKEEWMKEAQN